MLANETLLFIHVVNAGSLSKAAKSLGLTPAAISKAITRLESHYSVKLLNRSTRSITMTEFGILLYQQSESILDTLKMAEDQLIKAHANPRGRIKLGAPSSFSEIILSRLLPKFLEQYHEIDIELCLNNKREMPEPGEYDLFIKAGNALGDSSIFRAKLLAKWEWVLCASPKYLRRKGAPKKPEDLATHICLDYNYRESGKTWVLKEKIKQQGKIKIIEHKVKHASNIDTANAVFVIACAKNHGGIILVPRFAVQEEIRSGRLKALLPECYLDPINIYLMHSFTPTAIPAKVRILMDFIYNKVNEVDYNEINP